VRWSGGDAGREHEQRHRGVQRRRGVNDRGHRGGHHHGREDQRALLVEHAVYRGDTRAEARGPRRPREQRHRERRAAGHGDRGRRARQCDGDRELAGLRVRLLPHREREHGDRGHRDEAGDRQHGRREHEAGTAGDQRERREHREPDLRAAAELGLRALAAVAEQHDQRLVGEERARGAGREQRAGDGRRQHERGGERDAELRVRAVLAGPQRAHSAGTIAPGAPVDPGAGNSDARTPCARGRDRRRCCARGLCRRGVTSSPYSTRTVPATFAAPI